MTKHDIVYDIDFKTLHLPKFCGHLIDNTADAPIYVLGDNDIETQLNM